MSRGTQTWAGWWASPWPGQEAKLSRVGVLLHVSMLITNYGETILYRYLNSDKGLFDQEPRMLLEGLHAFDPNFWGDRAAYSDIVKMAEIGRALRRTLAQDQPKHEKPNLRGPRATVAVSRVGSIRQERPHA